MAKHYHVISLEGDTTCRTKRIADEQARALKQELIRRGYEYEVREIRIEACEDTSCTIDITEEGWF